MKVILQLEKLFFTVNLKYNFLRHSFKFCFYKSPYSNEKMNCFLKRFKKNFAFSACSFFWNILHIGLKNKVFDTPSSFGKVVV